jgi:hypothetical protein
MNLLSKVNKRSKSSGKGNSGTPINWKLASPPYANYKDALWIHLTPMRYTSQSTISRRGKSLFGESYDVTAESFTLLAPVAISFAVSHTYERYDSIASRAATAVARWQRVGSEVGQMAGGVVSGSGNTSDAVATAFKNVLGSFGNGAGGVNQTLEALSGMGKQAGVTNAVTYSRIDAPMVYKDTANMRYALEFEFGAYKDPYNEITRPIQSLMAYSCPIPKDDLATIEPPYAFKVVARANGQSRPLFKVDYAALVTVQPTFHQPYKNGNPTKATLVLEFVDIEPTYQHTFDVNYEGQSTVVVKQSDDVKQTEEQKTNMQRDFENYANTVH